MKVGEYIKKLRIEHGYSQEQLGKLIGVQRAAVQKWESGQVQNLKRDTIKDLCNIFNVTPNEFFQSDPIESNAVILPSNVYMIPLFESVSAGFGACANDCIIDYIPLPIISDSEARATICIKVSGDSMYPKIEDGDKIVVRKQSSVDSGSVGVFLIDNEDAVVKKVIYAPGEDWLELHSFNPEYITRRFDGADLERVRVLGLVKQVIKEI